MMSGFQSFGNCPISKHVHNQCAKLVLPSCEPKTKQREAMARITPHPEPQDVCALPHVRDDSLLVVALSQDRARVKKKIRKWQALPKKIRDFCNFAVILGGFW